MDLTLAEAFILQGRWMTDDSSASCRSVGLASFGSLLGRLVRRVRGDELRGHRLVQSMHCIDCWVRSCLSTQRAKPTLPCPECAPSPRFNYKYTSRQTDRNCFSQKLRGTVFRLRLLEGVASSHAADEVSGDAARHERSNQTRIWCEARLR
jgi:hypothetical protein